MFRYVCPHCLRTFLSDVALEDPFCWECGQSLVRIPKEDYES
jgi:rRNA maturation endonuclease Nob1